MAAVLSERIVLSYFYSHYQVTELTKLQIHFIKRTTISASHVHVNINSCLKIQVCPWLHVLHRNFPYYKRAKRFDYNAQDGLSTRLSVVGASILRLNQSGSSYMSEYMEIVGYRGGSSFSTVARTSTSNVVRAGKIRKKGYFLAVFRCQGDKTMWDE